MDVSTLYIYRKRAVCILLILSIACTALSGCGAEWKTSSYTSSEAAELLRGKGADESDLVNEVTSWIVKWKSADLRDDEILSQSIILSEQDTLGISVLEPQPDVDLDDWLKQIKQSDAVAYVEPNQRVRTLAAATIQPNDPYYSQQMYLKQIKADAAWVKKKNAQDITIALVDTGVDFNHPDLVDNIVSGVNLLDNSLPMDDNGHGTNVAGVLAATGNNSKGVAGIAWSAKIMPVKALDSRGYGDEDKLGAGILYAVDNGAKIVVMSVGLYRYSKYMQEIVDYAEQKEVLLIAATGNDGLRYLGKIAVKYPAAYPSVIAVGGSTTQLSVDSRSNSGPEVDLVAPWNVFTTARGGGYKASEGTSMAAPQVAGVAALVWSMNPSLKPYQIREHLRRTAQDIGDKGWDSKSGYGLLRADLAINTVPQNDSLSSNATRGTARIMPIDTMQNSILSTAGDSDWYRVDAPYDGVLELNVQRISGSGPISARHYAGSSSSYRTYTALTQGTVAIHVSKGTHYLQIISNQATKSNPIAYKVWSHFQIGEDPFEPNDKQYEAYNLSARKQEVTGTFDHKGDEDWYVMQLPSKGTVTLKVTADTVRIDPQMEIKGSSLIHTKLVDENAEGQSEMTVLSDLEPGKLYIKVTNAVTAKAESVAGKYTLYVDFTKQYTDPNEPNDKQYEAVTVVPAADYHGVFDTDTDKDWFQIKIAEPIYVQFHVDQIPRTKRMEMKLYKDGSKLLQSQRSESGKTSMEIGLKLERGTYYVQLSTDGKFDMQTYRFRVNLTKLFNGMRDIEGHWAQSAIVNAINKGWMNGFGNAEFGPDRTITRAEAAAVMAKAFELKPVSTGGTSTFKDVPAKHWAYQAIEQVAKANIANGYQESLFGPSRQVTRAEMAVMIGNALQITPDMPQSSPFSDVRLNYWAAPMISEMKERGILGGAMDNRFMPERPATRAEFVTLLDKVLG